MYRQEAARRASIEPAKWLMWGICSRDVTGTRKPGFGMVIILPDASEKDDPVPDEFKPDLVIHSLGELLEHFPGRNGHQG